MVSGNKRPAPISRSSWITALVLSGTALIATAALYNRLPSSVPVHWNIMGEADSYGPRYMVWVLGSLPLLTALLMRLLPQIDPRRGNYEKSERAYNAVFLATVTLMTLIHLMVLAVSVGIDLRADMIVKAGVGVLFVVIGNYLGTIRSTFFFGIRTPWTLSNDEIWRRTHRLGGRLFILAGFCFIVSSFFRGLLSAILPFSALAIAVTVPLVYSCVIYKRQAPPD
ncbi:SdpI family protein [Marispirochaeta sp.]|uniref:SdpI family protein n=1 Tax=Marispirochaeta sp. TaxID=2038653 RepID=UPI0029C86EB1|nr:SdpI family protein [Marispirochaeta sp.]